MVTRPVVLAWAFTWGCILGALVLLVSCAADPSRAGDSGDSEGPLLVPITPCTLSDGGAGVLWCPDADGDGLGDAAPVLACAALCLEPGLYPPRAGACAYFRSCA